MITTLRLFLSGTILAAVAITSANAEDLATPHSLDSAYPLSTCPVSGEELGSMGDPIVKVYQGREVKFCCKGCVTKFEADQESFLSQLDAKITAQQGQDYPVATCPVDGKKLDAGSVVNYIHQNRLVRLSSADCVADFAQSPEKYLAPLNEAVADSQRDDYPLTTCVVTGHELGKMGAPVEVVVGTTLVRLCCADCESKLAKDPAGYVEKLSNGGAGTEEPAIAGSGSGHDHSKHDHGSDHDSH